MIVVADTTPLNHLILIDEVDLLPVLSGRSCFRRRPSRSYSTPKRLPKCGNGWLIYRRGWRCAQWLQSQVPR